MDCEVVKKPGNTGTLDETKLLEMHMLQDNGPICAGLKTRDSQVLDRLILEYQHRLLRYLLCLTGSRDISEDIFQDIWIRVIERGEQFKGNSRFGTWLFAIARNMVFDLRRKYARMTLYRWHELEDEYPLELPSGGKTALDQCSESEARKLIADALRTLKPVHREVLLLRYTEDLSLKEISEVMRLPISTVKSRLYRGLVTLKPRLNAAAL